MRVDGPLIFNISPPQVDAALAGLGVTLLPEDELATGRVVRPMNGRLLASSSAAFGVVCVSTSDGTEPFIECLQRSDSVEKLAEHSLRCSFGGASTLANVAIVDPGSI